MKTKNFTATERERLTETAGLEFRRFMICLKNEHKITHGEVFEILSDYMSTEAAFLRRWERHGRYDKKACVD